MKKLVIGTGMFFFMILGLIGNETNDQFLMNMSANNKNSSIINNSLQLNAYMKQDKDTSEKGFFRKLQINPKEYEIVCKIRTN